MLLQSVIRERETTTSPSNAGSQIGGGNVGSQTLRISMAGSYGEIEAGELLTDIADSLSASAHRL
jgi:hypothetical protein